MILTNFEKLYRREWDLKEQTKELTEIKHKLKELNTSYLLEKQEQLNNLLCSNKTDKMLIEEEIKILEQELETKIEISPK